MSVNIYAGRAGDRNPRAMSGSIVMGNAIAARLGTHPTCLGSFASPIEGGWSVQLRAAAPDLQVLADRLGELLDAGKCPISTMGRCAASIATLPQVARRFPDATIVWFDAHGDCNVPTEGADSEINYLGGMVLSGTAGEWDTGLGSGLMLGNVVLVGARDLDPPEQARISSGQIRLVRGGANLGSRLAEAIGGRRTYIHIDCDVLDAGLLATEYQSPGGLTFDGLQEACRALAAFDVIGLEITEYEACWPDGRECSTDQFLDALEPLLARLSTAVTPL